MAILERKERLCRGCGTVRGHEEFAFKNVAVGKRHSRCRICCRKVSRRHYEQNHAGYIERKRRNSPRFHELVKLRIYRYLLDHACASCGLADPVVLEFNHRDPSTKTANISDLVQQMASAERLDAEIAKCEVLCANCHQRRTTLDRPRHYKLGWWIESAMSGVNDPRQAANVRNARLVWDHLAERYCVDCGEIDLLVLQFDHREQKTTDIGRLVGNGCSSRLLAGELAKCDIRCANCDRRRTAQRGGWFRTRQVGFIPQVSMYANR